MHRFVLLNGEIISTTEAQISAVSSSALYGLGVFTAIAIYHGLPFLWEKHWLRLSGNAEKLQIDRRAFSEENTRQMLADLIKKSEVNNGRVRLTFFDESSSKIWPFETDRKTSLLVTIAEVRPRPESVRVTLSPFAINSASPLAAVKSCNYLEKILALDDAKRRGFDEAIQLNEHGNIASACMSNIFWVTKGEMFTPSLQTGCLPGTTREFVMENIKCIEIEAGIDSLKSADAIFLTSAGIGIARIAEFDGLRFKETDHPMLKLLKEV